MINNIWHVAYNADAPAGVVARARKRFPMTRPGCRQPFRTT